ncbi:MAG: ATP-binding cassette domain-containing protein [Propionibacteriales bacterium]|nr:ATP-binding cassette domain-containing protein [Propionibacteriales bacterium]
MIDADGRGQLLEINDLRVGFQGPSGTMQAVRGVTLDVAPGRVMGLVGESGSGKSVTAMSVLGLHDKRRVVQSGSIRLLGRDLLGLSDKELTDIRGSVASMVFQDPMTALNPVLTLGRQLNGVIRAHQPEISRGHATERAVELLSLVNLPEPRTQLSRYPHELSGGMRQRVMIAMAIANDPKLIIADEPTTALDVTIQDQVLRVLKRAKEETGAGVLLITHDLGVVAEMCDEVAVMYAGRIVETAWVQRLFENPGHPYTKALMRSRPLMSERKPSLDAIPGMAASASSKIDGCRFHPRCPLSDHSAGCDSIEPPLTGATGHLVACHRATWDGDGAAWTLPPEPGNEDMQ